MAPDSFEHSQLHVMRKYFRDKRARHIFQWVQEKVVEYLHESSEQAHVGKRENICCLTFKRILMITLAAITSTSVDTRLALPPKKAGCSVKAIFKLPGTLRVSRKLRVTDI
jgi:hypothetical protein